MSASRAVDRWTLGSLGSACLDLALAYLLLSAAAAAFLAAKLLSLLRLPLPFSAPLHSLLVDLPASKIDALHRALRSRLPFDVILLRRGDSSSASSSSSSSSLSSRSAIEASGPERPPIRQRRRHQSPPTSSGESTPRDAAQPYSSLLICEREPTLRLRSGSEPLNFLALSGAGSGELEKGEPCGRKGGDQSDGASAVTIMSLKRALEEERSARAALNLELEKEMSAAATAADEAMAMIQRLQKEKGAVEIEARQYKRMAEEKSAYHEEEMVILKEIIVKMERENHVLKKEMEAYNQMVLHSTGEEDEPSGITQQEMASMVEQKPSPWLGVADAILQPFCDSIEDNQINDPQTSNSVEDFAQVNDHDARINCEKDKNSHGKSVVECQEDGCTTFEILPSLQSDTLNDYQEHREEDGQDKDHTSCDSAGNESDVPLLDVHVIDVEIRNSTDQSGGVENASTEVGCVHHSSSNVFTSQMTPGMDIKRSFLDVSKLKKSVMRPKNRNADDMNSAPAVFIKELRLENEVELLRKRLRAVQHGREKLSLVIDQEKAAFQMQLLEEIACQLKEIKNATEARPHGCLDSLPRRSHKARHTRR